MHNLEPFFKSNLALIVDGMARRYHQMPSQILKQDLQDFNLDLAIYYKAMLVEQKEIDKLTKKNKPRVTGNSLSFGNFSIKRIVKKKKGHKK